MEILARMQWEITPIRGLASYRHMGRGEKQGKQERMWCFAEHAAMARCFNRDIPLREPVWASLEILTYVQVPWDALKLPLAHYNTNISYGQGFATIFWTYVCTSMLAYARKFEPKCLGNKTCVSSLIYQVPWLCSLAHWTKASCMNLKGRQCSWEPFPCLLTCDK